MPLPTQPHPTKNTPTFSTLFFLSFFLLWKKPLLLLFSFLYVHHFLPLKNENNEEDESSQLYVPLKERRRIMVEN